MNPCTKKRFETREEADAFTEDQTPYWCKRCKCWHNTSNGRSMMYKMGGNHQIAEEWIRRHRMPKKKQSKRQRKNNAWNMEEFE